MGKGGVRGRVLVTMCRKCVNDGWRAFRILGCLEEVNLQAETQV